MIPDITTITNPSCTWAYCKQHYLNYSTLQWENSIVIDVRSEAEYAHAHIPGAVSIPIFNNEERKEIGTTYKQISRTKAIKIGLKYFGNKMVNIVEQVEHLVSASNVQPTIIVHCWRGGMRSKAFTWLLNFYGFNAIQLEGGYKAYRHWCLEQISKDYPFIIIGGHTGCAKTEILAQLKLNGEAVIDLEHIAQHKGSAYGGIEMGMQPSQEQFENLLSMQLFANTNARKIFIEDESQRIGLVNIPNTLWQTIRTKPIYFIQLSFKERLKHIVTEYSQYKIQELIECTERIQKNLGGLATKQVIDFLQKGDYTNAFSVLLLYYDKYYEKGMQKRENYKILLNIVTCAINDPIINAKKILSSLS